jgi:catechol 2,3-dioxygenase-like lactoylglutathione lyase family enzyme
MTFAQLLRRPSAEACAHGRLRRARGNEEGAALVDMSADLPAGGTMHERRTPMIRVKLTSIMVDDQAKAFDFYTRVLGFVVKHDIPMGGPRWLTVVAADDPDGVELLLEPNSGLAAAPVFQKALYDAGIPITMLGVDDIEAEYQRLKALGVVFRGPPTQPVAGPSTVTFDDTCGNFIRLFQI